MKKFKLIALALTSLFVFATFSTAAPSKDFGVVDLNKVIDNYTEAQKVAADLKVKENELQGFVEDAQKKVKEAKSPVEKKNLEEKFSEEFNIKRNAYVKSQSEKWDTIESNILKGIQEIYTRKKLEMVFNKQSVIVGGTDITDELIKNLNETVKK